MKQLILSLTCFYLQTVSPDVDGAYTNSVSRTSFFGLSSRLIVHQGEVGNAYACVTITKILSLTIKQLDTLKVRSGNLVLLPRILQFEIENFVAC